MAKNAQTIAAKWKRNLIQNKQSIIEGVNAVTESPTMAAARKVDKYASGVQRAVEDGSFVAGCKSVTREAWVQSMLQKGIPNLERGAALAEGKVADFQAQFLPFAEQVSQQIKQMPDSTESDRDARMLANAQKLRQFKMQRRSS